MFTKPFFSFTLAHDRRKRKNQSQAVQETYNRYPVSSNSNGADQFHLNGPSMAPNGVPVNNNSSSAMSMHEQSRQEAMMGQQYGQVNGWSQSSSAMERCIPSFDTSFNTRQSLQQQMHNSYSQPGYMSGPNQRMTAFPPNGSHTSMNGNAMSNGMNGAMQCAPMSMHAHSANGGGMMQQTGQNTLSHAEMNSMGLPANGLNKNNPGMTMNASAMYASSNAQGGRMRSNGYSPAAAGQQQQQHQLQQQQQQHHQHHPQQQQPQSFPVSQNKRAAIGTPPTGGQHSGQQYGMGNAPFSTNSMSNSYGPQSQTHQFNSNQVSALICLL